MIRRIIHIDEEKCNGCGLCAGACHEGAIGMVNGKAKLLRDDYCDGLGDCLPACPAGAIAFIEREAAAYDEAAVLEHKRNQEENKENKDGQRENDGKTADGEKKGMKGEGAKLEDSGVPRPAAFGCPGSRMREFGREMERRAVSGCSAAGENVAGENAAGAFSAGGNAACVPESELRQWPVQIKLVPVNAPYFDNAKLLVAADCTAYAYGNFHRDFMRGKVTLIGCPKLDACDYTEKLAMILSQNNIRSLTIVRMEVPCCKGIEHAAVNALKSSGKFIPWQVVTLSLDGRILE